MDKEKFIFCLLTSGLLMTSALFAGVYEWIDDDGWRDSSLEELEI